MALEKIQFIVWIKKKKKNVITVRNNCDPWQFFTYLCSVGGISFYLLFREAEHIFFFFLRIGRFPLLGQPGHVHLAYLHQIIDFSRHLGGTDTSFSTSASSLSKSSDRLKYVATWCCTAWYSHLGLYAIGNIQYIPNAGMWLSQHTWLNSYGIKPKSRFGTASSHRACHRFWQAGSTGSGNLMLHLCPFRRLGNRKKLAKRSMSPWLSPRTCLPFCCLDNLGLKGL